MKVGKTAAFAIGGGIILLQIAQNQGYIRIDWDRIRKKAANTTEAVENNLSSNAPTWMDQVLINMIIVCVYIFLRGILGQEIHQ